MYMFARTLWSCHGGQLMEKILHPKMSDGVILCSSMLSPPRSPPALNIAAWRRVDPPANGKNLAPSNHPRCQQPTLKRGGTGAAPARRQSPSKEASSGAPQIFGCKIFSINRRPRTCFCLSSLARRRDLRSDDPQLWSPCNACSWDRVHPPTCV